MGLFDTGFDMSDLLTYLNPMGTAQAATLPGETPVPTGTPTADQLLNSQSARNPIAPPPPPLPITPTPVPTTVIQPTAGGPTNPNAEPFRLNPPGVTGGLPTPPPTIPVAQPVVSPTVANAGTPALGRGSADSGLPPDVGSALTGEKPSTGSSPATEMSAQARDKQIKETLAAALKGVQAPKSPELQKISSPSPPRPTGTIKGGDLAALLQVLNAGTGRRLPTTLGRG